jgi:hypothetical protein
MIALHSLLRYAVLILLIAAVIKGFAGWFKKKPFTAGDEKIGLLLLIFTHVQLVIGLILYFTSDMMKAIPGMAASMKDPVLRFWKVEHIAAMVLAVVLITLGRRMAKSAKEDLAKHRRSAVYYTLALILIISAIPWALRGWNPF